MYYFLAVTVLNDYSNFSKSALILQIHTVLVVRENIYSQTTEFYCVFHLKTFACRELKTF